MLNSIKKVIAHQKIKEDLKRRKVETVSFDKMKHIGLVYQELESSDEQFIQAFIQFMESKNKQVHRLIFVPEKELSESKTSKLRLDYFSQKEVNSIGLPASPITDSFTSENFDLLIDASLIDSSPIEWIMKKSQSKLKIGFEGLSYSDVFDIQLSIQTDLNLRYLLQQIEHYAQLLR